VEAAIGRDAQRSGPGVSLPPVLRIENLSKSFGGVRALDAVNLAVGHGEVHGLLGQNGSGKSTLIKILSGFHEPDPGARLWLGGREIPLPIPPGECRASGISFVHQNLGLVASLTVIENLLVSDLAAENRWLIDWRREVQRARELFARYAITLDPTAPVARLSPVERAQLAIVRAFDQLRSVRRQESAAGLLVLDEPTPFLPAHDVDALFRLVREIVADGASVVFVSHDIDEVRTITDRATVLRDGRVAGTFETAAMSKGEIVRMIVGQHVDLETMRPPPRRFDDRHIAIRGLSGGAVRNFSATLRRGEVIGLTGLIGSGYDDLVYMLYGATRADRGSIEFDGRRLSIADLTPTKAIAAGCVLIPGDRQAAGAVPTLDVVDNLSLPVLDEIGRAWALSERALGRNARGLAERFDVRPRDPSLLFGALSGGNQQKVLLAKWLQLSPRLILLDEPTQGVDVGARAQVFAAIAKAADQGATVLCASADYEQLTAICHRIFVFARGVVVGELVGSQISKSMIAETCYKNAQGDLSEVFS